MVDIYVNRKPYSPDDDLLAQKSTSFDQYETISSTTEDEFNNVKKTEYLNLTTGLVNAANNRDFFSLNQMLVPLIDDKNVEFLDSVCALHWCCFSGHVDLVDKLLDVGCDPFLPDPINYESPVYYAVKSSNAHIISVLLKRFGPLILCHENKKCKTPFLVAVSEFTEDDLIAVLHVLEFLYLSGVSLEEQDNNGTTALMFACKRGELFVVQWLVRKGADLSHRDHFGATVLHYAVLGSNLDIVMFLTQNGMANLITIKSLNNNQIIEKLTDQTPLDICKEKKNHLQYLLLWLCLIQWKIFGKVFSFNSIYPIFYWLITLINLIFMFPMWKTINNYNTIGNITLYILLFSFFVTELLWFITKSSNAGISNNYKYDHNIPFSPTNKIKLTPFEGVLDSLHKRQQVVNFEFYCINKDLKKNFLININNNNNKYKYNKIYDNNYSNGDLLTPLNNDELENPCMIRINTCNEELNRITTEIRSVYPQVANERCMKNTINYNKAVLNFENPSKVCLTCSKIKAMREHHCSSCNTCLIRQDHHCAWVDNCIGAGNQRKFFVFLTFLFFTFVQYYRLLLKYFSTKFSNGIYFFDILLFVFGFLINGILLIFVIHLWTRTVRSMLTDVTYYEYLKKPNHIRLRYKGNVFETFWDFKTLNFNNLVSNFTKFWTYKTYDYEKETV